jgi:hypothetical protein
MSKPLSKQFVVCVQNEGYSASREKRKIYVALRDRAAEKHGQLRVIDESGDDDLKAFFRTIALPQSIKKAVLSLSTSRANDGARPSFRQESRGMRFMPPQPGSGSAPLSAPTVSRRVLRGHSAGVCRGFPGGKPPKGEEATAPG